MLVDKKNELEKIFKEAERLNMPVAVHCEESSIIAVNTKAIKEQEGEDPESGPSRNESLCWGWEQAPIWKAGCLLPQLCCL